MEGKRLLTILQKLIRRTRKNGVWDVLGWIDFRLREEYWEWRLGVDTKGVVDRRSLGLDASCFDYMPARYGPIRKAFGHVGVKPGDVLLDYGAGKGRIICFASRLPYVKIVGVEISPELAAIAKRNVAQTKSPVCQNVEVVTANAREFTPPDDITTVFLFNSFGPPVVDNVGECLKASVVRRPRELVIIYLSSRREGDHLSRWDWITLSAELPVRGDDDDRLLIYRHHPGTAPVNNAL